MEFKLRYQESFPEIWKALEGIPRTGWVKRKVLNPESVKEHIISCRELVISLIADLPEFSMSEILEILNMLEVHDYPEKITGDGVITTKNLEERKKLKAEKFRNEYDAMFEISKNSGEIGKGVFNLWLRFEKNDDRLSIFAKQIDKYQSIEKAWEYEQRGEKVRAEDFINGYLEEITHPLLRRKMFAIKRLCKQSS